MSAQPTLPPRPARSQAGFAAKQDAPAIPPRPQRSVERSVSPHRAEYTRSPLNEPPSSMSNGKLYGHKNLSASDLPRRPPSVNLPSIGQEGAEYASFDAPDETNGTAEQTRNVASDLPMHAPRPSVPQSTAKTRIATVTRTDSSQAAAAGVGKAQSDAEDTEHRPHPLKARSSFSQSNVSLPPSSSSRPGSVYQNEEGIPEIGLQVPMLRHAGDVQAPSPSPFAQTQSPGIGFFNDGSDKPRNHHRKRSSRQEFGPPGSYGMHGHGLEPKDQFEKAWYQKHPEALAREHREYDPGHPKHDWALSSDDLNKLVHQSASRGAGFATSRDVTSTPAEEIGYLASEEYASRMISPKPTPASLDTLKPRASSGTQPAVESPLRKASFPVNDTGAVESAVEDDNVIHVDPPAHRHSKIHGGGYDPPTDDLGPQGGNTEELGGWIDERGYGAPILASDEVAKNPGGEYLQPAVSPEQERRGDDYYAGFDSEHPPMYQSGRRGSKPSSRPNSRPQSMHGEPLARFLSRENREGSGIGTPLEEIEEYEPLFPEDGGKQQKPKVAADKLKRPDLARHHFPSQDIWEDTPESLQYQTTVETPQMPEENEAGSAPASTSASQVFERPEKEQERKEGSAPNDRAHYLTEETKEFAKPGFNPSVLADMPTRPGMNQRFPSRDIWEDTPDSLRLETTVDTPQMEEQQEMLSPQDAQKPEIPARPAQGPGEAAPQIPARPPQRQHQVPPADAKVPQIPPRPGASKEASPTDRKAPTIPDRPKPQVPARPAKPVRSESQEGAPLNKVTSGGSAGSDATSPPAPKAKPAVPARPAGNKISALKAGFLNDLNSRLALGPQAPPKVSEPPAEEAAAETEKAPLADARKGRARGPARRKPAASPSGADDTAGKTSTITFFQPITVFSIGEDGRLHVPVGANDSVDAAKDEVEKIAARNTSESAPADAPEDEKQKVSGLGADQIGAAGDTPDPRLSQGTIERHEAIQPELEQALGTADKVAGNAEEMTSTREDKEEEPESKSYTDSATSAVSNVASAVKDSVSGILGGGAPEASADAAKPSEAEEVRKDEKPQMTSHSVQTGQQDMSITSPTGEQSKMTTFLGGNAPEDGNVIVKPDGEEIVGPMDQRSHTIKTGHGM